MRFFRTFTIGLVAASLLPALPTNAADGVDTSPLPLIAVRAYPKYKPRRPVAITHAGDGSNRVFVATQHGVVHVFANDQNCLLYTSDAADE